MRNLVRSLGLLACACAPLGAHASEAPAQDWPAQYERGIKASGGGIIAGGAGILMGGMGTVVVLAAGGCGTSGDVCDGPWIGDGLAVTGMLTAVFGSGALAAGSLRSRRALRSQDIVVTKSPGLMTWVLVGAAAVSTASWIGLRQPTEYLPKMPAINDVALFSLTGGLLVGAYSLGLWQRIVVKKAGNGVEWTAEEDDGLGWVVVPMVGEGRKGAVLSVRF